MPIPNSTAAPIAIVRVFRGAGLSVRPSSDRRAEYTPRPSVRNPSAAVANRSGMARTALAPSHTPGKPASRIKPERLRFRLLARQCRPAAPTPKATLATLWVARAEAKGSPSRISAGNCTSPAPPPANADRALAITAMTASPTCSSGSKLIHPWVRNAIGTEKVTMAWGSPGNMATQATSRSLWASRDFITKSVASSMLHIGASPWRRSSL